MHNKIRIIAEAGSNFDADLVKAKELIHAETKLEPII